MRKFSDIYLFLLAITCSFALSNCTSSSDTTIVQVKDYEPYLNSNWATTAPKTIQLNEQLEFWNKKLEKQPTSGLYKMKVAGLLAQRFKLKGNVADIEQSDNLLKDALANPLLKKAGCYHALSGNAIAQHQFKAALAYADAAWKTQEAPETSQFMRFDALMELGDVKAANEILEQSDVKNSFDYSVRKSKLQDAQGDLPAAIMTLVQTKDWITASKNKDAYCWVMSNLGDMYGHAGEIEKSYEHYLKVLEVDPSYSHVLKGIAWIAYSNDKDLETAKRIVHFLETTYPSPDYNLLLAEIAAYEGNEALEEKHIAQFKKQVSDKKYGRMYHSHLADICLSDKAILEEAKTYIEQEIENRPTAKSYLLLARYFNESGNTPKAMSIIEKHVAGKTEEPDVLFHIGLIAQSNGQFAMAQEYLKEAQTATFELGPMMSQEITEATN